jgi:glyoxylase-like metal-dependent hydrolase (beta-lactamase superfamily II)
MSADFSRRQILAGSAAVTLSMTLNDPARAQATAHRFKVGAFEVTVLSDGSMSQQTSFVLPKTPAAEAEALFKPAPVAFADIALNVTLVRTPDDLILIDCGGGAEFLPTLGRFADRLEAAGIKPEAITRVILTHAHPDHFWGLIDPFEGATRFPQAKHYMTAAERDFWLDPNVADGLADVLKGMANGTHRRLKTVAERIEPTKAGADIVPGVTLIDTGGHTPGHVSVLLKSGADTLLIGGDVLTHPLVSFARPEWVWGPDLDAERAVTSRRRTLGMLAGEKIPLLGTHLPWPGLGRVEKADGGFRFVV